MRCRFVITTLIISILTCAAGFTGAFFGYGFLVWVSAPLLGYCACEKSPRVTAFIFASFSFFCWLLIAHWLPFGINAMIPNYAIFGYLTLLALASLSAVPYFAFGLVAAKCGWFGVKNPRPLAAAALVSLLVELWPARLPGTLGHALVFETLVIQIVDIGGSGMLSFLVYGCGFLLVKMVSLDQNRAARIRTFLVLVSLLVGDVLYGMNRMARWDPAHLKAPALSVALVQPNLPLEHLVTAGSVGKSLSSLGEQTANILRGGVDVDLIVWPEIPLYFSPHNQMADKEFLNVLLKNSSVPLLANADSFESEFVFGRVPFYNTVQLFRGNGEIEQEYRKMILVPFGEFLPFEGWLPDWALRLLGDLRRYVSGDAVRLIELNEKVKIGTPICLEAHHPDLIHEMVQRGATVLVNPANDAYFGTTMGAYVDLVLTLYRAIEYRIPVIRVTNSGVSAVVDQRGKIVENSMMPQFVADSRVVQVVPSAQARVFSPKDFGIILLSLIVAGACISRRAEVKE